MQALLLLGRSPETNDTVIPPSIVEKVTDGVVVYAPRGPFPEISPGVYGMGQVRYSYQGHEVCGHVYISQRAAFISRFGLLNPLVH